MMADSFCIAECVCLCQSGGQVAFHNYHQIPSLDLDQSSLYVLA